MHPLLKALEDSANSQLQGIAAWLLGRLGDKQAIDPLWAMLGKSVNYKVIIAQALVRLGDARGISPFLAEMDQVTNTLNRESASSGILMNFEWRLARAVDALVDIGPPAFEPLLMRLSDSNARMRALAASGLGRLGDRRAAEPLTTALNDPDERVRSAAKEALRQLGSMFNK